MEHPVTGDRIDLRVEDYCPYLDDYGSTIPLHMAYDIAATCSIVKPVCMQASQRGTDTGVSAPAVAAEPDEFEAPQLQDSDADPLSMTVLSAFRLFLCRYPMISYRICVAA